MSRATTYGNILVKSPDNTDLFKCNDDKANWYLKRDLAEIIQEDPKIIRLKFIPEGNGNSGDGFYFQDFKNICVVCGSEKDLSIHHIFPICYRKFLPQDIIDKISKHNMYDIRLVCETCHHDYEIKATELKKEISRKYNVAFYGIWNDLAKEQEFNNAMKVNKYCHALINHYDRIPEEKKNTMLNTIRTLLGNPDVTIETIKNIPMMSTGGYKPSLKSSEVILRKIVSNPSDLDDFIIMWRKHFVEHMNPKFMPTDWDVERRVCQLKGVEKIWND